MRLSKCRNCKNWVRFETGCWYGTCLKKVRKHVNKANYPVYNPFYNAATTHEGDSCEEFEEREQTEED